jgi:hypothetical protein
MTESKANAKPLRAIAESANDKKSRRNP